MAERQFAWTGELPAEGFAGFVKISVEDDGVLFAARSEGAAEPQAYKIPLDVAAHMLTEALRSVGQSVGRPENQLPKSVTVPTR